MGKMYMTLSFFVLSYKPLPSCLLKIKYIPAPVTKSPIKDPNNPNLDRIKVEVTPIPITPTAW